MRRLLLLLLLLVLLALLLNLVPIRAPGNEVMRLRRDESGQMSGPSAGLSLEVWLGTSELDYEANSYTSSQKNPLGATLYRWETTPLVAGRIWVVDLSGHGLARHFATLQVEALRAIDLVDEILYLPFGAKPPEGEPAPDLFLTVDLEAIRERHLPGRIEFDARLRVDLGASPWDLETSAGRSESRLVSNLSCSGEARGFFLAGTKYGKAAEALSSILHLDEQLAKWSDDWTVDERPPLAWNTAGVLPVDLPFLRRKELLTLQEGPRFLYHDASSWLLDVADGAETDELRAEIIAELEAAGWERDELVLDRWNAERGMRLVKGERWVDVATTHSILLEEPDSPQAAPAAITLVHRHPWTLEETRTQLFAQANAGASQRKIPTRREIQRFLSHIPRTVREALFSRLRKENDSTARTVLEAAASAYDPE